MAALGYIRGKNIVIECRGAADRPEQRRAFAEQLAALKVDIIVAQSTPSALAAQRATTAIPIVMLGVANPVGSGLVASLARPGGNITGPSSLGPGRL
jgi:putative ABC transport system substrate-binding protein